MDLEHIEDRWALRPQGWIEFWKAITSLNSRQFFWAVLREVKHKNEQKISDWIGDKKQKDIMAYGDTQVDLVRLEPFFRAHLISALAALKKQQDPQWTSRNYKGDIEDVLVELKKKHKIDASDLEHVTYPLLRDLTKALQTELKPQRVASLEKQEEKPARVIIAPFALVPKEAGEEVVLAQFRFERIPRDDEDEDRECEVYLAHEQVFLRMEKRFYDSVFDAAKRSVQKLLEGNKEACLNCDVRVRIEEFDEQNIHPSTGLFDPQGAIDGRKGVLYDKQLMGRSASGAAAWGLYFVRTAKAPDPGLIVLAKVDSEQGVSGLPAQLIRKKVRAIEKSGRFDTIVVYKEDESDSAKGDITVMNI